MQQVYNISEFAKLINVSASTLRRWDREGILTSNRSPTNRRFYTHDQYLEYLKPRDEQTSEAAYDKQT